MNNNTCSPTTTISRRVVSLDAATRFLRENGYLGNGEPLFTPGSREYLERVKQATFEKRCLQGGKTSPR